jgi:2-polyprenyl-3-methyl-5-hydroxy-6-metoxy-1,4-benzoquinol methylase
MYVFDNAAPQAPARLSALAEVFDPGTIRQLDARGIAEGWRCLEVGGGLGTMTKWLSARVGPHGSVLTTDIDTRHLDTLSLANVDIRHHDVVEDPLPAERFDLAYTRLVLEHVSDPTRALANMVQAVKPGGWVVIEDFEIAPTGPDEVPKTFLAMRQVIAAVGVDQRFGRSMSRRLQSCGLEDVMAEGRVLLWSGRNAGTTLMRLNAEQLRDRILATGLVTADQYAEDLRSLEDEAFELRAPTMWTAWGRRPAR